MRSAQSETRFKHTKRYERQYEGRTGIGVNGVVHGHGRAWVIDLTEVLHLGLLVLAANEPGHHIKINMISVEMRMHDLKERVSYRPTAVGPKVLASGCVLSGANRQGQVPHEPIRAADAKIKFLPSTQETVCVCVCCKSLLCLAQCLGLRSLLLIWR